MSGVVCIHKDEKEGTYYLFKQDIGYYIYSANALSGEEELHGPYLYTDMVGLPTHPQTFMGF